MPDRWLYGWALGYVAVGAASLLIPLFALTLGGGPLLVGVLASTAAFAGVPGALLWGWLAGRTDRRRPFVLVALAATGVVIAVTPLVRSPWPLVAVNAALWFVVTAATPVLNLVVVDGVPEDRWDAALGRLNAYQGYGWVGGLLLGTVWTGVATPVLGPVRAQTLLFRLLAAVAFAGLLVVRLEYPERPTVGPRRFRRWYRELGLSPVSARIVRAVPLGLGRTYWTLTGMRLDRSGPGRPLAGYLAGVGLFATGFAVFWAPMPAYLTAVDLSTGAVFALFLLSSLGSAVCYDRVPPLSERLGSLEAQVGALGVRAVLFVGVALVGGWAAALRTPALAAAFFGIGATWAVVAVTATGIVVRLAGDDRAQALGWYTAVFGVGTGLGSVAGGLLAAGSGYAVTFGVAAASVLLGAGSVLATGRRPAPSRDALERGT